MQKISLTRDNLVRAIKSEMKISTNDASQLIDATINKIVNAILQEQEVKIRLFGSFLIRHKSERIGRNPKTKEEVMISARKVVRFYPSIRLRSQIKNELFFHG